MKFAKNDQVKVNNQEGTATGTVKDCFIQNTTLEADGKTFKAKATAENPVYFIEFASGKKDLVSENSLTMKKPHTA